MGADGSYRPWVKPCQDSRSVAYSYSEALDACARDNFVATMSVTYVPLPLSLRS